MTRHRVRRLRPLASAARIAVAAGLVAAIAPAASAAPPTACAYLAARVDATGGAGTGPVFLKSYGTDAVGPLQNAAFTYDNAVAAIALVGCGDLQRARRIGDAFVYAAAHDRFWTDGRLRNGYAVGPVGPGAVKLPGWWDKGLGRWLEDDYQAGSDSGNLAWAGLALMALDEADTASPDSGAKRPYRAAALGLGRFIALQRDTRGPGGFMGGLFGHEPAPVQRTWKSTEHNVDIAAFFHRLAGATGDGQWDERAREAAAFVDAMWDGAQARFSIGTAPDGVTRNPHHALDAQLWPLLALPDGAQRYAAAVGEAERTQKVDGGFDFNDDRDGIWYEGTAQVAVLYRFLGREADARALLDLIEADRAPDGGFFATREPTVTTGLEDPVEPTKPLLYRRLPHLAVAGWVAMGGAGVNPFNDRQRTAP